jgi:hypothetical protein
MAVKQGIMRVKVAVELSVCVMFHCSYVLVSTVMLRSVVLATANMIHTYVSTNISIQLCHLRVYLSPLITAHVPLIDLSGSPFNLK